MCGIFAAIIPKDAPDFNFTGSEFRDLETRGPDCHHSERISFNDNFDLVLAGWTLNLRSESPTAMPTPNKKILFSVLEKSGFYSSV